MTAQRSGLERLDVTRESLTDRTIVVVREAIQNGSMVPGELYSVYQLSKDLGVSRSPVRDALLRLEETGLVRFERNRGFRILQPGPREIAELFAARIALEGQGAALAARKVTPEQLADMDTEIAAMHAATEADDEPTFLLHDQRLHSLILHAAGNEYVRTIIDNIRDATRLVGVSTIENKRDLYEVYGEHTPIVAALRDHDAAAAEAAMDTHVRHTGYGILRRVINETGSELDPDVVWADLVSVDPA